MSDQQAAEGGQEREDPPPKRRKDDSHGGSKSRLEPECIVHIPGLQYGPMVLLSTTKDSTARLARLKEIRDKRLAQPHGSVQHMTSTCDLIPDSLTECHGYHRECYQRFTMNLSRLSTPSDPSTPSCSKLSRRDSSGDKVLFSSDCIFCNSKGRRKVKIKGTHTTEGLSQFECDGWRTVLEVAENKCDEKLLTRIRGHDLFATEAKYHKSCRVIYTQNPEKWRSTSTEDKERQTNMAQAHSQAFAEVQKVIERDIIRGKHMIKLSELSSIYIKHEKYKDSLAFCRLHRTGNFQTYIVYNADSGTSDAVRCAYELGSLDMVQESGRYLHRMILDTEATEDPF